MRRSAFWIVGLAVCLVACGGGSPGSDDTDDEPQPDAGVDPGGDSGPPPPPPDGGLAPREEDSFEPNTTVGCADPTWGAAPAGDYEDVAPLEIRNDSIAARVCEIAYSGVPIAETAALTDTDALVVVDDEGQWIPAQFDVLARWGGVADGSNPIKWVRVAIQTGIEPSSTATFTLRRYDDVAEPSSVLETNVTGSTVTIDTGAAEFVVAGMNPGLFESVAVGPDGDRVTVISDDGGGPRLVLEGGMSLAEEDVDTTFEVISTGPIEVILAQHGHFEGPGSMTLCENGSDDYQRFGFTTYAHFARGRADVDIEFHFRNECGDAFGGPWIDQAITVAQVAWDVVLDLGGDPTHWYGGSGEITTADDDVVIEQGKGSGSPWTRQATVTIGDSEVDGAVQYTRPIVAIGNTERAASISLPWMRFREPQAIEARDETLSAYFISEDLVVGEAKGIWNSFRISFLSDPSVEGLEVARQMAWLAHERGLLVRPTAAHLNSTRVFPNLGTDAGSTLRDQYVGILTSLHDDTVGGGGQWDRARTWGSQLWPDTQRDGYAIDYDTPEDNDAAMNYWNPSGAELYEYYRTGDPKWAWDMALPASWLQMFTAYCNIGAQSHGNRNGFALTSGGSGEGQWHRSNEGSDDYSYNMGMQLAYLIRPSGALLDRFAEAGATVVSRYDIPQSDEDEREEFVSEIVIARQTVQHFEMLANCAEFVPGDDGEECHDRLDDILSELIEDNLSAGVMCYGDVRSNTECDTPQQFMQTAMMVPFFMRNYLQYGDEFGDLGEALVRIAETYLEYGLTQLGGGAIDPEADFAAGFLCTLGSGGTEVTNCEPAMDSDGNLAVYGPSKAHTLSILLLAEQIDPDVELCEAVVPAYDESTLYTLMDEWTYDGAGYWKGANQMLQGLVFSVGGYELCEAE